MNSNEAKSAIFDSIRRNLAESLSFDRVHSEHQIAQQKAESLVQEESFAENAPLFFSDSKDINLAESFCENLVSIGGNCVSAQTETEAVTEINRIIAKINPQKIAVSDNDLVIQIKRLLATNAEILSNASASELFECDLGITGAQFGIAETGTLVLESEREFNRLASLVPPVHICVLEARNLQRTLGETLAILEKDLSRAVTFITGPSRTSDIELTLAIGVHGPAELHVIVVND